MSDDQLLAIASTSVLASKHFPRPMDEWEALPRASKTWTAWKAHYRAAHLTCKRQMLAAGKTTHGTAHAAVAIETPLPPDTYAHLDDYLDNLAAVAMTECTTMTQLIENNASLTASNRPHGEYHGTHFCIHTVGNREGCPDGTNQRQKD